MDNQIRRVRKGSKGKGRRLAETVKAVKPDVDNSLLVVGYVNAVQLLTLDLIERYEGDHSVIEELRAKLHRNPEWLPDTYSISRIFAAAQLYAALIEGESEASTARMFKGTRQEMVDRLLEKDMPDSLDEPDFL